MRPSRTIADRWQIAASRWSKPLVFGLVTVGVLALAASVATWLGGGAAWGFDFAAYYDAAVRLAATRTPYQPETLGGPFSPTAYGLYLYSPFPAVTVLPLTLLPFEAAVAAWLIVRLAALGLACWLMPVSPIIRLATFGVAAMSWPVLHDLGLGNVSVVVTLALVVAWRWLDRPLSAVGLAVATLLRPTAGITFVWLLLRRQGRLLLSAIAALALLAAATLLFVEPRAWLDFASLLRNVTGVLGARQNADLGSAVIHLGGPEWLAQVALFAGVAVAITAIVLSLRRDAETSYMVTVVAMLLLSPVMWSHYLVQLILPAAFLAERGRPWALAIPLLGWLPYPLLPFVCLLVLLAILVAAPGPRKSGSPVGRPAEGGTAVAAA